jgi:hypothetical protein
VGLDVAMTASMAPAALLAAAALGLAACGGDGASPSASSSGAPDRAALVAFARCMREQGIDMPDPSPGNGPTVIRAMGKSGADDMRKAEAACADERAKIKPPELTEEQRAEVKRQALENARCMREHGIDFPDPQFDEHGGVEVRIDKDSGIRPDDPDFKAAMEACQDTLPDRGTQAVGE